MATMTDPEPDGAQCTRVKISIKCIMVIAATAEGRGVNLCAKKYGFPSFLPDLFVVVEDHLRYVSGDDALPFSIP